MRWVNVARSVSQYGGIDASSVFKLDGPTMSTPARERVGCERERGERRVAAVRTAHDRDARGVGDPLGDEPVLWRRADRCALRPPTRGRRR